MSPLFLRIWLGQWVSNLGTQISLFGLGLWLFKADGQLGSFALVSVVVQLSRLAVSRLLVRKLERWPRRRVMLIANAVGALGTLGLATRIYASGGSLTTPEVLPFLAIAAAAEATQVVTFSTLVHQLVPTSQVAKAGGLFSTSDGFAALLAPPLGALLVVWSGLRGVVILDCISCLVAFFCVALGRWPRQASAPSLFSALQSSATSAGLRGIIPLVWSHKQLRALLCLGSALMLVFAAAEIIFPAWVMELPGDRSRLAVAMGLSVIAYLTGLLMWRVLARLPNLWTKAFVACLACQSFILMGACIPGIVNSSFLWYSGIAFFNFLVPIELASQQSLWQVWVVPQLQPRIFPVRYATDWMSRLMAVISVGPLVDHFMRIAIPGALIASPMSSALGLLGIILMSSVLVFWRLIQVKMDAPLISGT